MRRRRVLYVVALLAWPLAWFFAAGPGVAGAQTDLYNCGDFTYQEQAQEILTTIRVTPTDLMAQWDPPLRGSPAAPARIFPPGPRAAVVRPPAPEVRAPAEPRAVVARGRWGSPAPARLSRSPGQD
jgi:hypothetical protein